MYNIRDEMVIKVQPNRWTCIPAAFATLLDMEIQTLLELVGHDGSEIIFDDLGEPYKRRAFLVQEFSLALWSLGYFVGDFLARPIAYTDQDHWYELKYHNSDVVFKEIMFNSIGVILGKTQTENAHATAWNGEKCYDSTGFIYPLEKYEIYSYHPVMKRTGKTGVISTLLD